MSMKSLWNNNQAKKLADDPLKLRVYTSQLLGQEPDLVLHGGGNTSVKAEATNLFGKTEQILYVKGSGWDLATIEAAGFAPVKLDVLKQMAALDKLSDTEMVSVQRSAMTDPSAPNPSVEAILHAIIPFKYVDHTHADAVVTITNTEKGEERIREIYGNRVLIVPYVMPGFILAKKVYEMTRDIDWKQIEGIILMNHGVFTFDDNAKSSYEKMIRIVTEAEGYLKLKMENGKWKMGKKAHVIASSQISGRINFLELARIRQAVSKTKGTAMIARLDDEPESLSFANLPDAASIAVRGPLTPDHVIRTKRIPVILTTDYADYHREIGAGTDLENDISSYSKAYRKYFDRHTNGKLTCLDPAPRWAVWPGRGTITFGSSVKESEIIADIKRHTILAIRSGEALEGWKALPEKDIFDIEYWELEQAKLRKGGLPLPLQGKIALVTGAASGIGRACVESLHAQGAAVAALDINPKITGLFNQKDIVELACDITDQKKVRKSVEATIRQFGGLDILISNAGIFPASKDIADMDAERWDQSIAINLTSHQRMLQACIPYLKQGITPAVVIIASKNVAAPGPGASAYSVAKAGLTQLARVAALELAASGIRVNVIHPNAVFDTAIWTEEVLKSRAKQYGMSVEQYRKDNLLKTEVTSKDVAALTCAMVGPIFGKTTGAQIPVDGGNVRVI